MPFPPRRSQRKAGHPQPKLTVASCAANRGIAAAGAVELTRDRSAILFAQAKREVCLVLKKRVARGGDSGAGEPALGAPKDRRLSLTGAGAEFAILENPLLDGRHPPNARLLNPIVPRLTGPAGLESKPCAKRVSGLSCLT